MSLSKIGSGASDDAGGFSSTSRTLTADTESVGDLVVLPVYLYEDSNNAVLNAPTGTTFTDHGPSTAFEGSGSGESRIHIFSRVIDGSEGASFGVSRSAQFFGTAQSLTLRGASALSVVSVTVGTPSSGAVNTINAPSVVVGATQAIICVYALSDPPGGTYTGPSGMTLGISEATEQSTVGRVYFESPAAGASGVRTLSWTGSARNAVGVTILVEGANAGGSDTTANPTGVAATGAAGTLAASGAANAALTGVAGTAAAGTLTAFVGATVVLAGVAASGSVGTLTQAHGSSVTLSGVSATGQAAALAPPVHMTIELVGVSAAGSAGTLTESHSGSIALTGVSASGAVGSLSTSADGSASVSLTGVQGAGAVGQLTLSYSASLELLGVGATGAAGTVSASTGTYYVPPSRTIRLAPRSRVIRL